MLLVYMSFHIICKHLNLFAIISCNAPSIVHFFNKFSHFEVTEKVGTTAVSFFVALIGTL